MNPLYTAVAERANYRCEYCRAPEEVFNFAFDVDHIRPVSRGGLDDLQNLALACRSCNAHKAAASAEHGAAAGPQPPLFDPRLYVWDEHFRLDTETAEIIGTTPIGQATLLRLRMNRPRQIAARMRWIQFGLLP